MNKTSKIISLVSLILFVFLGAGYLYIKKEPTRPEQFQGRERKSLSIRKHMFDIVISKTKAELTQGLSNTHQIEENEGMLFIFPESGYYPFWMKDMNYSIDIVWINESYRIVYIKENATSDSYPNSFVSKEEAKYVLEVKSGYVKAHDISVGEYIMIH